MPQAAEGVAAFGEHCDMLLHRMICDKCGGDAITLTSNGIETLKFDDPTATVTLTIRCPKCGERKQIEPPDGAIGATSKRAYLSH
jgi:Zn finger protein HypA/HybF involved in hydrogenase expression